MRHSHTSCSTPQKGALRAPLLFHHFVALLNYLLSLKIVSLIVCVTSRRSNVDIKITFVLVGTNIACDSHKSHFALQNRNISTRAHHFVALLNYLLSLKIVSLIICMTHREGFSGESSVGNYRREKLLLLHRFKLKSDTVRSFGKLRQNV